MKKEVLLKLVSIQTIGKDSSKTELITSGSMQKQDNKWIIEYNESEATGFKGCTTTLTVDGDKQVTILRRGSTNSELTIEKDVKHHCHYGTPYGDFIVGIYAHSIVNELKNYKGSLYTKYTIDINSSYISDNEIMITI